MRISSGKKILSSGDDPGGLSVSMKLQSEISITNAVQNSVENAKSFTELQDGAQIGRRYYNGDVVFAIQVFKRKYYR